jgi:hypothetical protein
VGTSLRWSLRKIKDEWWMLIYSQGLKNAGRKIASAGFIFTVLT